MHLVSIEANNVFQGDVLWAISGASFGKINLIVGKNATGKTRLLGFISSLSGVLCGAKPVPDDKAFFSAIFQEGEDKYDLKLSYDSNKILEETLIKNSEILLRRDEQGFGFLLSKSYEKPKTIPTSGPINIPAEGETSPSYFKVPENMAALNVKRDPMASPHFEPLWSWSSTLKKYDFNQGLGQTSALTKSDAFKREFDFRDQNACLAMFAKAEKEIGRPFLDSILSDMNELGYKLEDIRLGMTKSVKIHFNNLEIAELYTIQIKEIDIPFFIEHIHLSTGMFRALSLIIQVNYSKHFETSSTILIDDIGEGLDYDRSTKLIHYLINQAEISNIQIIMATNDRFVMNTVPLKYWCVLSRVGYKVQMIDMKSKPDIIDKFDYTGLSNFDFFTSNFLSTGSIEE